MCVSFLGKKNYSRRGWGKGIGGGGERWGRKENGHWILGLRERKVSEMICRFLSCITGWLVVSITDKGSSQRGVIHALHLINDIYKTWYFWQAIQWWRTLGRILASWSLQSIRGDITEQLCINVKLQLWVVEHILMLRVMNFPLLGSLLWASLRRWHLFGDLKNEQ